MDRGPPSVGLLKTYNYYIVTAGWLAGLIYYLWFFRGNARPGGVEIVLLFTIGAMLVPALIATTTATIAAAITFRTTGTLEGSTDCFLAILWVAPFFGFFAAKYILVLL